MEELKNKEHILLELLSNKEYTKLRQTAADM